MSELPSLDDIDWGAELGSIEEKPAEFQEAPLKTSRTPSGTARRGRRPTKRLSALQMKLSSEMFQAGTILGFGAPTTGYYICQESDAFTKAVVDLAQNKTEWLEALEKVGNISPGITVGRTMLGIGVAFAVDRKRVEPDKAISRLLGVQMAYEKVHPDEELSANSYSPPPHGAFVPVT